MFPKVSIIIPVLNAEQHILLLLHHIESQTFSPKEIIIIDSSENYLVKKNIDEHSFNIPIIYQKAFFAYPGHARNIGVSLSTCEWIAFLDIRTLPISTWLETSMSLATKKNAEYVSGVMIASANTTFKRLLRATTYGGNIIKTVPGALVLKTAFNKTNGFAPHVRAGEDIDWVNKLKKHNIKMISHETPTIVYDGFPETFSKAIKKWVVYSFANAKTEIYKERKFAYLLLILIFILIFTYNWNAIFASWNSDSVYFVPNITKIYLIIVFVIYFIFRGLLKPLLIREKISFLLPWRWILVGLLAVSLDVVKAPGLIYGAYLLIKKKLSFNT